MAWTACSYSFSSQATKKRASLSFPPLFLESLIRYGYMDIKQTYSKAMPDTYEYSTISHVFHNSIVVCEKTVGPFTLCNNYTM